MFISCKPVKIHFIFHTYYNYCQFKKVLTGYVIVLKFRMSMREKLHFLLSPWTIFFYFVNNKQTIVFGLFIFIGSALELEPRTLNMPDKHYHRAPSPMFLNLLMAHFSPSVWVCRLYGKAKDDATVTTRPLCFPGRFRGEMPNLCLELLLSGKISIAAKPRCECVCLCTCTHALMCYPTPTSVKQGF